MNRIKGIFFSLLNQPLIKNAHLPGAVLLLTLIFPQTIFSDEILSISKIPSIEVKNCSTYPYHSGNQGESRLLKHFAQGLQKGLSCLMGNGTAGRLHNFHEQQARQLLSLLNSNEPKQFQCVQDDLFAYAMASSPDQIITDPDLKKRLQTSPRLSIFLDTYRLGGLLSQKFNKQTYENFFNMDREQITEHLTGKPLRLKGLHRYKNLPGLLFHETIHWLGHTHTNLSPDVTFLYETCCFGGSDYINDEEANAEFQARACNILKDDELWSAGSDRQKEIWKQKGYSRFKREMRRYY